MRSKLRVLVRMAALVWSALQAWCSYVRVYVRSRSRPSKRARAEWLQRTCARTLPRIGVSYAVEGTPPAAGMIVSNHVSYLDIFVISASLPCVFVAKKEIERWPLFGMMSHFAGTIFVDRERNTDIHRAGSEMQQVLASGVVAVLFPEGTSSDGAQVLPFRSPFFEFAGTNARLTPAYISYELDDGDAGLEVAYWGEMALASHVLNLFSKQHISARLRFGDPTESGGDRKQMAALMRERVMALATKHR
jgi:1-acyl-sn-glycerol-3-phosphate acyltransferase